MVIDNLRLLKKLARKRSHMGRQQNDISLKMLTGGKGQVSRMYSCSDSKRGFRYE